MKTKNKGQGLVEFALILPILLLLLLGIIEGARIIWAYVQLQNAVREAARYAVTGQPYDANGDPWSNDVSEPERAEAIKQVAVDYVSTGLGVTISATAASDYETFASKPGAFGVLVMGQRQATDTFDEMDIDYGGKPGLNVFVQAYYNIQMVDPIFAAILAPGWVRINAQVAMQNEGFDVAAGGLAAVGLGSAPDFPGGGDAPGGSSRIPRITIVEDQPAPAGTTITILLEDHQPSTTYDVFFDDQLIGTVTTNEQFFAQLSYYISISTSAGGHSIHSELPGSGTPVASTPIEVDQPSGPAIEVEGGDRWPAGSPITIRVFKHDPDTTYRIRFAGNEIGTLTTGADGSGSLDYTIPSAWAEGTVFIESLTQDGSSTPADTQILIVSADIVVQGGTVWPAGTRIFIFLRDHAPNQTYSVYFQGTQIGSSVTTNAIGEAILSYVIPSSTDDGTYVIRSQQGTSTIAQLSLTVSTPLEAYIVVVGGYEWPAGSPITIQLRDHSPNSPYDVYFGDNFVGEFTVDAGGDYSIAYVIPITQPGGVHRLRSVRTDNDEEEAFKEVTVTAMPNITVDGGLFHAPGAAITVRLANHAPDAAYDVYLGGVKIGTVITNGSGQGSLAYTIPPGTPPGDYELESRPEGGTTTIASVMLSVRPPDLTVVALDTPANPVFNTEMPITVTIRNQSPTAITSQFFDVDLYVDPTLAPTAGDAGLPPGSRKYWYDTVPASGTLTINDSVTLWGSQEHQLYARADTSGNILESDETNNILGKVVVPVGCALEIADEFGGSGSPAGWGSVFYGNAGAYDLTAPTVEQTGGALFIRSEGRSTTQADDDNASNAGYAFVYREGSGDFDVYVQLVSNAYSYSTNRRSGLEVRDELDGTAAKVNLLLDRGDRVRLGTRSNSNVATAFPDTPFPIWLRLLRRGSTFSAYYALGTADVPPQPDDWIFMRDVEVPMDGTMYVGLVNAAQYYDSQTDRNWSSSTFDHFHYCGDPAGALTCGQVKEKGGTVFIEAINFTDNVARGGQSWAKTTRAGLAGMAVPEAGVTRDIGDLGNSPQLQYQARFTTPGRYYIALLGWGPDGNSDSVHLGLDGASPTTMGGFTTNPSDPPGWVRNSNWYVDIPSTGSYTLNLYMHEDGAQVYKIALFTQVDYPLDGFGPEQSECEVMDPEDIPPGLAVCNQVLVNGDFEGNPATQVYPYWTMAAGEQVGLNTVHYDAGVFGVYMPSSLVGGLPRQPWLYQEFVLPDWILASTTATLDLYKAADWVDAIDNGDEHLYFELRSTGGISLTNPLAVATGADTPNLDPGSYGDGDWRQVRSNVIDLMRPGFDLSNFAGQTLRAYFYSPNPGTNSTDFYLDKISLEICTDQPRPDPFTNRLTGRTMVNQSFRAGVSVWAYQVQSGGQAGGPVYSTYSIQDGSYDFYDLTAGLYLVYAEYWLSGTRYWTQALVSVPSSGTRTKDLILYP